MKIQKFKEWLEYKGKQFRIIKYCPDDFEIEKVVRIKDGFIFERFIAYSHKDYPNLEMRIRKFEDDHIHVQYKNSEKDTCRLLPEIHRFQINSLKFTIDGKFLWAEESL